MRLQKIKIALIHIPTGLGPYDGTLKTVHDNFGVLPSLSLGYVASIMEKCGCVVKYFDMRAEKLTPQKLLKLLNDFGPDILGFSLNTYHFHECMHWIRFIKENIPKPVLVGGVHMSYYPLETFSYPEIDYAVIGEAEETLPELIKAFRGEIMLANVQGIVFRKDNQVVMTPARAALKNVDMAPYPARHLYPMDKYYTFVSRIRNFTPLMSSRGCPFKCIYCEQGHQAFRPHSAEYVINEIEECINKYGVQEIDIFDSSFTIQKDRIFQICELIHKKGLKFHWSVRSRVDTVNRPLLKAMAEAGCYRMYYGIESGVPEILKTLKKATNIEQIRQTIQDSQDCGIESLGFFMIGCPGDNLETVKRTIKFSLELSLDYAMYNVVRALPGTELYDMVLPLNNMVDYWREYILDATKSDFVARSGTELSTEECERLARDAFRRFYYRPTYILKKLKKIKSFEEFYKHARAAADMIFKG